MCVCVCLCFRLNLRNHSAWIKLNAAYNRAVNSILLLVESEQCEKVRNKLSTSSAKLNYRAYVCCLKRVFREQSSSLNIEERMRKAQKVHGVTFFPAYINLSFMQMVFAMKIPWQHWTIGHKLYGLINEQICNTYVHTNSMGISLGDPHIHTNIYLSFKATVRQAFATNRKRKRDHGPIVTMAPKKPLKQLLNRKPTHMGTCTCTRV